MATEDPLMLNSLPKVAGHELRELQRVCIRLMRLEEEEKFPGSQPVSFERRHLAAPDEAPATGRRSVSLMKQEFYAAEKTDGVRYMLLILRDKGAFMVDRNFEMRQLPPMHFPSRKQGEKQAKFIDNTLLDGELVEDATQGDSGLKLRYLAYDACCVCGETVNGEPLTTRLMMARREVLAPRYEAAASGAHDFSGEPFAIELKDFFKVEHLPHIFTHVQPSHGEGKHLFTFQDPLRKLKHGNDGIIFTPVVDAYVPGTCQSLLKWKPSNMNSIDFRISTKWRTEQGKSGPQPRFILMVADRATLVGYDWITFSPEQQQRFANDTRADERIIECVYDPKHVTVFYELEDEAEPTWDNPRERLGGWKYERVREDKKIPNDIRTVESIKQSVADGVTQNELLQRLNLAQQGVSSDKGFGGM